ncbi:hypothetical protein ACQPZZ_20445 [Microbispora sp. CA-135349]|uniref:hypothetical protein n=1 Tax=Microbispora sp. CA-135349 TaxID=3239953 RepID=UPI003D9353C1
MITMSDMDLLAERLRAARLPAESAYETAGGVGAVAGMVTPRGVPRSPAAVPREVPAVKADAFPRTGGPPTV